MAETRREADLAQLLTELARILHQMALTIAPDDAVQDARAPRRPPRRGPAEPRAPSARAAPSMHPREAALRDWRRAQARADGVPPYVILDNKTIFAIVQAAPSDLPSLALVPGMGPRRLESHGTAILAVLSAHPDGSLATPESPPPSPVKRAMGP